MRRKFKTIAYFSFSKKMHHTVDSETICLNSEQVAVYGCVYYFDIFKYPLKQSEIFEFAGKSILQKDIENTLEVLVALDIISTCKGFYFLHGKNQARIETRTIAEQRFQKKKKTIKRFGKLISKFPFVESVSISGSCSKGILDAEGDVDYFIITAPNRVWLCRTLLIAFKKMFLFNSKKYFCVNYFIDVDHLEILDKNTFVAAEICTLIPLNNEGLFQKFLKVNDWTMQFFPNKQNYNPAFLKERKPQKYLSLLIELLLNNGFGNLLDKWCFLLTLNKWMKKFPDFSKEDFDLNLRSKKNVSKHHPRGYQKIVLTELRKRLAKVTVQAL